MTENRFKFLKMKTKQTRKRTFILNTRMCFGSKTLKIVDGNRRWRIIDGNMNRNESEHQCL